MPVPEEAIPLRTDPPSCTFLSQMFTDSIQCYYSEFNCKNRNEFKSSEHFAFQGCQTHFHEGPHPPRGCLQRAKYNLVLYKCSCSLTVKPALGAATGQKQGAGPDKTRWRAGFGLRAVCLPPVLYTNRLKEVIAAA